MTKIGSLVSSKLKNYVYMYSDPMTKDPFYVGRGKGNRVFDHLKKTQTDVFKRIDQIRKEKSAEPLVEILIHGLDENTAKSVESAVIDLIGKDKLVNKQLGKGSDIFGRISVEQATSVLAPKSIKSINEPVLIIRIKKTFRYSMLPVELYDVTRGQWSIDFKRALKVRYVFSVYDGIVQEVYKVLSWHKSGTTLNTRENLIIDNSEYEFVGNIAEEKIRKKYRFRSVKHMFRQGNKNPLKYINC